jgi:hypothetical protein
VVDLEHSTDDVLGRSTLAEIQRNVIKKNKRNVISRLFHANDDKDTIAGWKSDLTRALHIFNVRSVVSVRLPLIVYSQTELAINTHVAVFDIQHDVTTTHTIVSDVQHDVATTHTIVSNVQNDVTSTHIMISDIHHIMRKSYEGADSNVGITCPIFVTE